MLKIFFDDRFVLLTDNRDNAELNEPGMGLFYPVHSQDDLDRVMEVFQTNWALRKLCVFSKDMKVLEHNFFSLFKNVDAAGGLVKNKKGEILVIRRLGKWDLPKGHVKKNEAFDVAAVREVIEECGITDLIIKKRLPTTYHTYELKNKKVLKTTYWYEMEYKGDEKLVPQTEEGITDVLWIKPAEIIRVVKNTYPSLLDVMEAGILG